jgi:signal transduction histidine kinase/ActR/RegA family two-component response regulator
MIGGLWVAAILLLGSIASAYVASSERNAAAERLAAVSDQLSALLQGNASLMTEAARTLARDPSVRRYLEATQISDQQVPLASGPSSDSALAALAASDRPTDRIAATQLLDASGRRLLSAGPLATHIDSLRTGAVLAAGTATDSGAVGPFLQAGDSVVMPVIAPVRVNGRQLGYVVQWRYGTNSPRQRAATLNLVGAESGIYIGSPGAGLWTDLAGVAPPPPVDVRALAGVREYQRASGARLGVARPVKGTPWYVVVEFSARRVLAPVREFITRAAVVGVAVLLLGWLGVWLVTRRMTRRLVRLTDAAESIDAGEGGPPRPEPGGDELIRLGAAFEQMADRVHDTRRQLEANVAQLQTAREQFAHTQRMEAVGRLAGGVAHDFNNLLTVILGEVDLGLARPEGDGKAALAEIRRAGERAALLTQQLLAFSRRQVVAPAVIDANVVVGDLEKMLVRLIGENVRITTRSSAPDAWIRADRGQIEQVLVNLVVNARDAMPAGGTVTIETAREHNCVTIAVTDTGTGMTEEVRGHLFEPFFTTKERGKGSGLGLATSYGIVRQAGGHIDVRTAVGVGTTMQVILPAVAPPEPDPGAASAAARPGHETILLVEDEPAVQRVAARALDARGYQVLTADDGEAALKVLGAPDRVVDLLLTDVVLQGMGGRELADAARRLRPGLRVLFVSGYTDDVVLQHRLVADDVHFLAKPYSPDALVQRVREVLDDGVA